MKLQIVHPWIDIRTCYVTLMFKSQARLQICLRLVIFAGPMKSWVLSHIPERTIQNRDVRISIPNSTLGQAHRVTHEAIICQCKIHVWQVQNEKKARSKSRGKIPLRNRNLVYILLNCVLCWRGQKPHTMGLHNSIMELHNSITGAPLKIMQLYINYGAPSPFQEVHGYLCITVELHGAPQFKSTMNYHSMCMGWFGLFLNWLHTEVYADHVALILND